MEENKKLIIAALVVIFGSNTTGLLNAFNPSFRADAFTSLDAAEQKEELRDEMHMLMDLVEEDFDAIRNRILVLEIGVNK